MHIGPLSRNLLENSHLYELEGDSRMRIVFCGEFRIVSNGSSSI